MIAENKMYFVGQKAFIKKDGKTLVIFDRTQRVDFPGGRIQCGENDLFESLKREVREEVGLEIFVGGPCAVWTTRFPEGHLHAGTDILLIAYSCSWVSGDVVLSEEHGTYRWVDASTYRECDNGSQYFPILEKYFINA
jgi:8-oxo-dGTP pyrophosphatase MutT (NUDIX family)